MASHDQRLRFHPYERRAGNSLFQLLVIALCLDLGIPDRSNRRQHRRRRSDSRATKRRHNWTRPINDDAGIPTRRFLPAIQSRASSAPCCTSCRALRRLCRFNMTNVRVRCISIALKFPTLRNLELGAARQFAQLAVCSCIPNTDLDMIISFVVDVVS